MSDVIGGGEEKYKNANKNRSCMYSEVKVCVCVCFAVVPIKDTGSQVTGAVLFSRSPARMYDGLVPAHII